MLPLIFILMHFFGSSVGERCQCSNKIVMLVDNSDYRVVSSPDYPRYYCSNLDCLWRIVAPTNTSQIHFFADNLDLRLGKDFIQFYDRRFLMDSEGGRPDYECTGDDVCKFRSSTQYLSIRFLTASGAIDHFGFQGIVQPFERKRRILTSLITRYSILLSICVLLFGGVCTAICILRQTRSSSEVPSTVLVSQSVDKVEKLESKEKLLQ